jgi:IS30 family transposase
VRPPAVPDVIRRRIETNLEIGQLIRELLLQRWSPQQVSRHLRRRFPDDPATWLCHESIYQAVYQPGSALLRPSKLAPHRRSPLRTGRDHRRAHQRVERSRPRFEQPMLTIHRRPFAPEDRSEAGHWEGDLIVGKNQHSAIGTPVERNTRVVRLLHLPQRDGDTLHEALKTRMADLPAALLRSISWGQGTEMARHLTITKSLGVPVYFCDSRSPWQRGSNEKHERAAARLLPERHRSEHPLTGTPAGNRERAQQAPETRSERPRTGRAVRSAASLQQSVRVATLTRTRPGVDSHTDQTLMAGGSASAPPHLGTYHLPQR